MRVTQYSLMMNEEKIPFLVKERCGNYKELQGDLTSPSLIAKLMTTCFRADKLPEEHVWVLSMTQKCGLIGVFEVSHGTASIAMASAREIMQRLLLSGAVNFVLVHNHPSGDATPSKEDVATTKNTLKVSEMLGIKMLDHIIIGDTYYSLREGGHVKFR